MNCLVGWCSINTRIFKYMASIHTQNCALAISRHIVTIHLTLTMSGLLLVIGSRAYRQMYEDLCHAVPDLEQTAYLFNNTMTLDDLDCVLQTDSGVLRHSQRETPIKIFSTTAVGSSATSLRGLDITSLTNSGASCFHCGAHNLS